jgi:hypothetical protein
VRGGFTAPEDGIAFADGMLAILRVHAEQVDSFTLKLSESILKV